MATVKTPLEATTDHHRETASCDLIVDTRSPSRMPRGTTPGAGSPRPEPRDADTGTTRPSRDTCDLLKETGGLEGGLVREARPAGHRHPGIETEALHAALKQKDLLISSLQSQLLAVCQSRSNRAAEREARQRERSLLQERALHLQQQIERRRAHLKNARLTVERMDSVERNIDDCIRRAELEYHLETEELNILNLQGERMRLKSRLEGAADGGSDTTSVSLSSCLPSHADVSLHCVTVPYDPDAPSFTVTHEAAEAGVQVDWARDHCGLSRGDRLLEVNGELVLGTGRPALLRLLAESGSPLRLLAVRCRPPRLAGRRGSAREAAALREELALLAGQLELKTRENKALHAEKERCCRETEAHRAENERLVRRAGQLEDRVAQMQGVLDKIRGATNESLRCTDDDSAVSQTHDDSSTVPRADEDGPVFPRGPHTATISVNVTDRPADGEENRRRGSPGRAAAPAEHGRPPQPAAVGQPAPFARQARPRLGQRPRQLLQRLQQLGERRLLAAAATLEKPRPPRKPARLSLQRAVSLQTLQPTEAAPAGDRRPPRPAVQTWPSMDGNLEAVRQRTRGVRLRHHMASLPRPSRPAPARPRDL